MPTRLLPISPTTPPDKLPRLLLVGETAAWLRCSTKHVRKLVREGALEVAPMGPHCHRIRRSSVIRFAEGGER